MNDILLAIPLWLAASVFSLGLANMLRPPSWDPASFAFLRALGTTWAGLTAVGLTAYII